MQGAFIKYAPAAAPAAATGISYAEGKLAFTAPTTTYTTGETLSGELTAHVVVDGTAQNLTVAAGAATELALELADGNHEAIITFENAAGVGPERIWEAYLGADQPTGVENLTAAIEGTTVTLTWDAPTASLNGGAFDDAAVRYNVVRYPDEVVVATAVAETTLTDELPAKHNPRKKTSTSSPSSTTMPTASVGPTQLIRALTSLATVLTIQTSTPMAAREWMTTSSLLPSNFRRTYNIVSPSMQTKLA